MNFASGHWYTSSVFWGPASGVIAAVVIGAVGTWVAWKAGYLKSRLYYALASDTSLLPARSIKGIEVRYGDKPLDAPRVVTVVLRNGGRRDITRGAFDGTPLRLDIGAHIVESLNVITAPPDQPVPQVTADGSVIVIEPVKISLRETISVELLIDGESPELRDPVQTLNDVDIRRDPGERPRSWLVGVGVICGAVVTIGLNVVANSTTGVYIGGWGWVLFSAIGGLLVGLIVLASTSPSRRTR